MIKDSRIEKIKSAAHKLGACGMEKNISSYRGLAQLLFSPRGSEFCAKQNFPTLELFQKIKNEAATCGVYTDAGNIHLSSRKNLCLAGDTSEVHPHYNPYARSVGHDRCFELCRVKSHQHQRLKC